MTVRFQAKRPIVRMFLQQMCFLLPGLGSALRLRRRVVSSKVIARVLPNYPLLLLWSALVLLVSPPLARAQSAAAQIKKEVANLSKAVQSKPESDEFWKDFKPRITPTLYQAQGALEAGRLYFALQELQEVKDQFQAGEYVDSHSDASKRGLPGFEAEWRRADRNLKAYEASYNTSRPEPLPAAVQSLAEVRWGRARTLYQASLAYGRAIGPEEGLYYLGESLEAAAFALRCKKLSFPKPLAQPMLRSFDSEIQSLQAEVRTAYQPPASIDHHRDFIKLNAEIKAAGELDASKLYYGALYEYLDALRQLASIGGNPIDESHADELRAQTRSLRQSLASSKTDTSIAEMFLERAEQELDSSPKDVSRLERLRDTKAILERVIPTYFQALATSEASAAPTSPQITVTLVRWPYT